MDPGNSMYLMKKYKFRKKMATAKILCIPVKFSLHLQTLSDGVYFLQRSLFFALSLHAETMPSMLIVNMINWAIRTAYTLKLHSERLLWSLNLKGSIKR